MANNQFTFASVEERFLSKVEVQEDGCWIWKGSRRANQRYGQFKYKGEMRSAHRVSYELFRGKITRNRSVCHKCDVTLCVNPKHLFLGTHDENMADMVNKGRRKDTHGERHPQVKLTIAQVIQIKEMAADGWPYPEIAKYFPVGHQAIGHIARGETWSHIKLYEPSTYV